MKKKKLISECYCEKKYGVDHSQIPELYLRQYYVAGKLFNSMQICSYCILKLMSYVGVELQARNTLPTATDYYVTTISNIDTQARDAWRAKNPQYAKLGDKVGIETLAFELNPNKRGFMEIPFEPKMIPMGIPQTTPKKAEKGIKITVEGSGDGHTVYE